MCVKKIVAKKTVVTQKNNRNRKYIAKRNSITSCSNYFHILEQKSFNKGISFYEYLEIPAFIRYGKNIEAGY